MSRTAVVIVLASLGLAGLPVAPVAAQARLVVPIIIQAPGPAARPAPAATRSIGVTTETTSSRPGVTTTRVTVQDTTGRVLGVVPTSRTPAPAPAGTSSSTQVMAPMALPPGVARTRITVQDTTGRAPGVGPTTHTTGPAPAGTAPVTVTVNRWHTGFGREIVSITSDGPIDAPIVILAP